MYQKIAAFLIISLVASTMAYLLQGRPGPANEDLPWSEAFARGRTLSRHVVISDALVDYDGEVARVALTVENRSPDTDLRSLSLRLIPRDCPATMSGDDADCAILHMADIEVVGPVSRGSRAGLGASLPIRIGPVAGHLTWTMTVVRFRAGTR